MKTEYQNIIIRRIKVLREQQGLSQAQLAMHLGISYGQMGNIESIRQNHKYTLDQINSICKLLKIPIEQIFLTDDDFEGNAEIINKLITNIIKYEK